MLPSNRNTQGSESRGTQVREKSILPFGRSSNVRASGSAGNLMSNVRGAGSTIMRNSSAGLLSGMPSPRMSKGGVATPRASKGNGPNKILDSRRGGTMALGAGDGP